MKKIAFYVEGQTEQFFINKLLIEIAGIKNIAIELKKFSGKYAPPSTAIYPKTVAAPHVPNHSALIYDCGGDEGVKPRMLEDFSGLKTNGYLKIIGIRDLFPLTDLAKLEHTLNNGVTINGTVKIPPLPNDCEIIVANNEVEAWFLAECNHFSCIDVLLQTVLITANIGYNPCTVDVTTIINPANELRKIYSLVGKSYSKDKKKVERTVECLDYANLYLSVANRVPQLQYLISIIDHFLN